MRDVHGEPNWSSHLKAVRDPIARSEPWNKGRLVGQKAALKLRDIWSLRVRLQLAGNSRALALFNLALDSKLRACDLVALRVSDICQGTELAARATILQRKTGQPVRFEITITTRDSLRAWLESSKLGVGAFLFPSRTNALRHLSTRQYARIVKNWVKQLGLDGYRYGTHSMRRTKVSIIYSRTKHLRAIQLLLGHTKLESTVRYLGIEVDDALELAEQVEL